MRILILGIEFLTGFRKSFGLQPRCPDADGRRGKRRNIDWDDRGLAPLFPAFMVFYEIEGEAYPATPSACEWVEQGKSSDVFFGDDGILFEHEPYASHDYTISRWR